MSSNPVPTALLSIQSDALAKLNDLLKGVAAPSLAASVANKAALVERARTALEHATRTRESVTAYWNERVSALQTEADHQQAELAQLRATAAQPAPAKVKAKAKAAARKDKK